MLGNTDFMHYLSLLQIYYILGSEICMPSLKCLKKHYCCHPRYIVRYYIDSGVMKGQCSINSHAT